ncbi:MAG: RNA methyltransferase [Cyanobacteria bacterium J06649_4]
MAQPSINQDALAAVRIVLVAPAGPLNVGSVARVMKNFGLSQLVLVNPQCDPLGAEALQMAVHADDILRAARRVGTSPEALVGCERAIATTARARGFDAPLLLPDQILPTLLTQSNGQGKCNTAILFGPEDRGLSNEELTYAQQFTKIPSSDNYSALNLAQAVAVCCYELYRASLEPSSPRPSSLGASSAKASNSTSASWQSVSPTLQNAPSSAKQTKSTHSSTRSPAHKPKATLDELEGYYQHLQSLLLTVEYLYPHTAESRMRKLRQLLHRAEPTSNEVALLRGIIRQVEWAISNAQSADTNQG